MTYIPDIAFETKEIARRYKDLLKGTYQELSDEEKKLIRKAFDLAVEAHSEQRRKTGEPYIYHPIAVAKIVADEIGLGGTAIAAALLHDVVEDTDFTVEDIEQLFGETVARIVNGLTKISNLKKDNASIQAENYRKMLLTLNDDVRVILIKIADRLHNMQTMSSMPNHKQLLKSSETLFIYAPLAHRLGLYSIKTELEDLGLKYTEPEVYYDIARRISETKEQREAYIESFTEILKNSLEKSDFKFEILGRTKSIFSIRKKMMKQSVSFDEVYDKFAIRIVFEQKTDDVKHDAWKIYSLVTDHFTPNPMRLRDWITQPKSTGYEALHTTVMGPKGRWVEVQIRSKEMNEIAEKGYAAHYKYKHGKEKETGLESWIAKIKDALEDTELNAIDFVENVKLNLYSKEIYTFTPNGEIKSLPKGATPIDFAYAVHTEVGRQCRGAKVNGKIVPLSRELQSGDQVEILTSKNQKPKLAWLDYTVTSRARTKIKNSLKDAKKKIAEEGKEILRRKLRSLKIKYNEPTINDLVSFFNLKTSLDLFFRIGNGVISNTELKKFNAQRGNSLLALFNKKFRRKKQTGPIEVSEQNYDSLVFGEDEQTLPYTFANCCNPIHGDKVFGFTTINEGMRVHKIQCPNAVNLRANYQYRILKAKWVDSTDREFKINIHFSGIDNDNIAREVTLLISMKENISFEKIHIDSADGTFEGSVRVGVKNNEYLLTLIKQLKQIEGVLEVHRDEK